MFDQPPKSITNKDFPGRSWLNASCANPACPNYGKTDVLCPKAGKDKKTGRQRYKCKRCEKTFYRLNPPEGMFEVNRIPENREGEAQPKEDLKPKQPQQKQAERKKVSFFLTYQAAQGLYEVCASLGIESSELLEGIGQGTLAVNLARKEIKLSPEAMAMFKQIKTRDSQG